MQPLRLAIYGPGLIGGSIALAAIQRGRCSHLTLWSRDPRERKAAERLAGADLVTDDPARAARDADLVVLCTPPTSLRELANRIAPHLRADAVVSDVASVKASLAEELTTLFLPAEGTGLSRYVGAHPMAGAERSGLDAARADLFENCVCLLTPREGRTNPEATARVEEFWQGLGARVRTMTPQAHDEAVAAVSHLPHLVAAVLAMLPEEADLCCAGPGWRDMTRLAGGSPDLWTEILSHNRGPVTYALRRLISRLSETVDRLEDGREGDLREFLAAAKRRREDPPS